ncbi:hypothetical protein EYB45_10400 [Erythrobacteraceae bacterium CFH 75059]|uniref:hypothetical protein n=1 Tax=Qipengyuania thermophila TaxID=2509361 RepID=UPI001020D8E2|nr:hypothetical protein [Qipengyuania thermophila]TCD02074.1 hypothetical protein EYB45_10400 [Erythrobacteraceae bacterium CFH 75059]
MTKHWRRLAAVAGAAIVTASCVADPGSPPAPRAPLVVPPQPATLEGQLAALRAAVEPYRDIAAAERAGWRPFGDDEPLMGQHYHSPGAPDYVHGDPLDFSRPNNLMYTEIGGRRVLTGVAYVVRLGDGEPLPEGFAGTQDRWHVHDFVRAVEAATEDRPLLRWLANSWLDAHYRGRGDNRGRLAMVHAWVTLPNPDGVFADYNRAVPYLKLGLPEGSWEGGTMAAARGLNLATTTGCTVQGGTLWVANATPEQTREIARACAEAATRVRAVLSGRPDRRAINQAGEAAWRDFDAVWRRVLTPQQQARIAALTEHGSDHGAGHHHH